MKQVPNGFKKLQSAAAAAVIEAARLCEAVRGDLASPGHLEKADTSPVTLADLGSQAVIAHLLREVAPDIPMLAEEESGIVEQDRDSAFARGLFTHVGRILPGLSDDDVVAAIGSNGPPAGAPLYWVLDPIDGTKGYLRGDQYAIALGLVEEGRVVFGVLGCPALEGAVGRGSLLMAGRGQGAWMRALEGATSWSPIRVSRAEDLAGFRLVESVEKAHSAHSHSKTVRERLGIEGASVRIDSQCKYATIARGDAELYLRLPTRPGYQEKVWDHAAGLVITEEAGGRVTDVDGRDLDFTAGSTLARNAGVVASNGPQHTRVIEALREVLRR